MKFSTAVLIAATGASANTAVSKNVTLVTETVDKFVTYCPEPTQITQNGKTYTITEATTFTITDCPCTVVKPVTQTATHTVCPPTGCAWNNGTNPTGTGAKPSATGTGGKVAPTAGAGKTAALSGAGLAGLVGLAAFVL